MRSVVSARLHTESRATDGGPESTSPGSTGSTGSANESPRGGAGSVADAVDGVTLGLALLSVGFHRGIVVRLGGTPLGQLTVPELTLYGALAASAVVRRLGSPRGGRVSAVDPGLRRAWFAFLSVVLASFVVNPSGFGIAAIARLVAISVLVGRVAARVRDRRWTAITGPLSATMVLQTAVVIAQRVHGGPLGLAAFGEHPSGFKPVNGVLLPAGTTVHTNAVALYGVVVATLIVAALADGVRVSRPQRVLHGLALVGCGICTGMSGSRTALIAVAFLVLVLGRSVLGRSVGDGPVRYGSVRDGPAAVSASSGSVASRRPAAIALGAYLAGLIGMALVQSKLWASRTAASGTTSLDQLGSGRMALVRQAWAVFRLSPILGVGPGNYLVHVLTNPAITRLSGEGAPVHNLWLQVLASYGVIGFAVFALVTAALVVTSRRAGPTGAMIALPVATIVFFDVAITLSPGFVLLGVCVGAVSGLAARTSVD